MIKRPITFLFACLLLYGCSERELEIRPEVAIMDGSDITSWKINTIADSRTGENLINTVLSDCEQDDLFTFYSTNKFVLYENNLKCEGDTSQSEILMEGVWNITTDNTYLHLISVDELIEFEVLEVTGKQFVVKDSLGRIYTYSRE